MIGRSIQGKRKENERRGEREIKEKGTES